MEEPLRDGFAKDWPAVVLFMTVSGVNTCGHTRHSYRVQVEKASAVRVVVHTNGPYELYQVKWCARCQYGANVP